MECWDENQSPLLFLFLYYDSSAKEFPLVEDKREILWYKAIKKSDLFKRRHLVKQGEFLGKATGDIDIVRLSHLYSTA